MFMVCITVSVFTDDFYTYTWASALLILDLMAVLEPYKWDKQKA